MKKFPLLLSLIITLFVGQSLTAQCTPDPSFTIPGFYPDTFPDGEVDVMYDATMSAVLPTDTTVTVPLVGTLTISFCAFEIDTIYLPDGLTYQCDQPGCAWTINHDGTINRGCIRVMGTPTEAAVDDSIEVVIKITPGYIDSARGNMCNTDSLRTELGIFWSTVEALLAQSANFQMRISNASAISPDLSTRIAMDLFPNPADSRSQLQFNLPEAKDINISLMDATGRLVQQIYDGNAIGQQDHDILTTDLSPGLYLVRVQVAGEGQVVRKLMVQ